MDPFRTATFPFPNPGATGMWAAFSLSPFKMNVLFEMHRRNTDAVTHASHIFFDGLSRMAERQGEAFATAFNDCGKATLAVFAAGTLEKRATNQVDAARHVCVSGVTCLQDLSDIAIRTNFTAIDVLNARVGEVFDELRGLVSSSAPPTTIGMIEAMPAVAEPETVAEDVPVVEELPPEEPDAAASPAPKASRKKPTRARKAARRPTTRS